MNSSELVQRLSAILCADVVGYSRLMSLDDQKTIAVLDACRGVFRFHIEAHSGRIVDMAGDSILAVFNSALGAVNAAMSVQAELEGMPHVVRDERMRFRIGIHLGDVTLKHDGTVYGDGVNIAARLEGLAPAGGIAVSDQVRTAVARKVTAAFADHGVQRIKNFSEPVQVYVLQTQGSQIERSPSSREAANPTSDRPSVAVLAFENMSGDPEQAFFADGITEDIITALSRFQALVVIARNSSFAYKGTAVDIKQVGRELGARYVVEGSVRRSGDRIRITAQLIDSTTGGHIWAEKYDRVLEDIFAVQEEVTECVVSAVAPYIDVGELSHARQRRSDFTAYELALRATALLHEGWQLSNHQARADGISLARKALLQDSACLTALHVIALGQWQNLLLGTTSDPQADWMEGMGAAGKGIALSRSETSHAARAALLAYSPSGARWDEAVVDARIACQINPQNCLALRMCAHILSNAGDPSEGIQLLERNLRLSPRDPFTSRTYEQLALAFFHKGEYRAGLEWGLKALSAAPEHGTIHLVMAALYVGLGDLPRASEAIETSRRLSPSLVQTRIQGNAAIREGKLKDRYITFIRIAARQEPASAADSLR